MQRKLRILLADDHRLLREGLRTLLQAEPDLEVVGEAEDGESAVRLALDIGPDVVVLDQHMPVSDGTAAALRLKRDRPDIRVVMLTMYDDAATVDRALRAGVRGFVVKDTGAAQLADAIRGVARGEVYLSPGVSDFVVQGYLSSSGEQVDPLTPRERELLQLVAEGRTSREIAEQLGVAAKTVQNVRTRIMDKLDIHSTAGLVRFAFRNGLAR